MQEAAAIVKSLLLQTTTLDNMISDAGYVNQSRLKELLGSFYNANAKAILPVVSGKIATRFLGIFDNEPSQTVTQLNTNMKNTSSMHEVWVSPSGTICKQI